MDNSSEELFVELTECYNGFYADISEPLEECVNNYGRATHIGSEIPIIACFDFGNLNNLLFNNRGSEINERGGIFLEAQSTFYILFADRYVFSKLGSEKRDSIMEAMENGYLNHMVKSVNQGEAVWHLYRKAILEYEKEAVSFGSSSQLTIFHNKKLIQRLGLEKDEALTKSLLEQILETGTAMFAQKMLNTFEDEL